LCSARPYRLLLVSQKWSYSTIGDSVRVNPFAGFSVNLALTRPIKKKVMTKFRPIKECYRLVDCSRPGYGGATCFVGNDQGKERTVRRT
jgi:hypothetical protein